MFVRALVSLRGVGATASALPVRASRLLSSSSLLWARLPQGERALLPANARPCALRSRGGPPLRARPLPSPAGFGGKAREKDAGSAEGEAAAAKKGAGKTGGGGGDKNGGKAGGDKGGGDTPPVDLATGALGVAVLGYVMYTLSRAGGSGESGPEMAWQVRAGKRVLACCRAPRAPPLTPPPPRGPLPRRSSARRCSRTASSTGWK